MALSADLVDAGAVLGATAAAVFAATVIQRATRTTQLVTPAQLFFLYYLVFVLVGGVMLTFDQGAGSYFHHPGTQNLTFLFTVVAGLPVFAAGVWVANRHLGFRPRPELRGRRGRTWEQRTPTPRTVALFAILAVLALAVTAFVFAASPSPLVFLIVHLGHGSLTNDLALHDTRLASISTNAGGLPYQALMYQFYGNLLPLLSILALAWWRLSRRRGWLLASLPLLALALLMAANSLAKHPLINLAILLYVAWHTFSERPLNWRVAGGVGAGLAALFFAIVLVTNRSVALPIVVWSSLRRLFLVQVEVLYSVFELIPAKVGFLKGGGLWMDIRNLRPGRKSTLDFGGWLYNNIVPDHPELHNIGSAPTTFVGQLYADFGVPAALLGMLAAGYLCQLVFIRYVRGPKTPLRWAVFVGLTASIPRLTTSSLVAIAFQYGIITTLLFGVYFAQGGRLLWPRPARFRPAVNDPPEPISAR